MTHLALFGWPVVVVILFRLCSVPVAIIAAILGGYLLLPSDFGINLPLLPTLNKTFVSSATALVCAYVLLRRNGATTQALPGWVPGSTTIRVLLGFLLIGGFVTVLLNDDRLVYETRSLPGLRTYDAFSITMNTLVGLLPFLLARKFLAHPEAHRTLLIGLCVAGLLYSLPALWEVRMSPQLSRQIYGYFPHSWLQHRRDGGFRPIVFLGHGLVLSLFFTLAGLSALAAFRAVTDQNRWRYLLAAAWLLGTVLLSKSFGAFVIALALGPVILFGGVRLQLLASAAIAGMVLLYPMLRGADLVPVDRVVDLAANVDAGRAASFQFRLDNEEILLDRASERPLFGWGGWGRWRAVDEQGQDITISDGLWVITIGERGWVGYLGQFGLLAMSIVMLAVRRKSYAVSMATAGLCVVMAANLLDLIPNAGLTPITWLIAGALVGRLEYAADKVAGAVPAATGPPRQPGYTRAPPAAAPPPEPDPGRPAPISAYTRQTRRHHRASPPGGAPSGRGLRPGPSSRRSDRS